MDNRHCESIRRDLMPYALDTLSQRRSIAVEAHLDGCESCRAALEAQRNRLGLLDGFEPETPPPGLAERTRVRLQQPRRSLAGLGLAATSIAVLSVVAIFAFGRSREAELRASTQGNMKAIGLVFKMYANQSEGERWPELAALERGWAPDLAPLRDQLITDPQILVSERHPERKKLKEALAQIWRGGAPEEAERLAGDSFAYLGYTVSDEAEFETLLRARVTNQIPTDGAAIPDNDGMPIQPLREGVERFLITDINNPGATARAQSTIPVLIEIAPWKYKKSVKDFEGTNVLYMDGHVEFVSVGTFPVLPWILDELSGIGRTPGE